MKLSPQIVIGTIALAIIGLSGCSSDIGSKIRIKFTRSTPRHLICLLAPEFFIAFEMGSKDSNDTFEDLYTFCSDYLKGNT